MPLVESLYAERGHFSIIILEGIFPVLDEGILVKSLLPEHDDSREMFHQV